ncbi:MAG TPA: acyltransferase [Stellaceae bacterium]|nr:acyltransferase [Stellaceae bacterium]
MNKGLSTYLDLVRLCAAAIVFGGHVVLMSGCYARPLTRSCRAGVALVPFHLPHSAVVLFFVLSGYVITYVATEREIRLRDFAVSRVARIYSVVVPAILLTIIIDLFLMSKSYVSGIPTYQYNHLWKYLVLSLAFGNESWFLSESMFSDVVMWSLCYEVWYYILFSSVFYLKGWMRWFACCAVFLIIGYKLWALLPAWLLGSMVYRMQAKYSMGLWTARALFISTLSIILLSFHFTGTHEIDAMADALSGGWLTEHMAGSRWFVGDTIIALFFSANVFAAKFARLDFGRWAAPIKFAASFSFTLYVVHWPLLQLLRGYFKVEVFEAIALVLLAVMLIGAVTERQNHRLRRLIIRIVGARRFAPIAGRADGPKPAIS